MVLLEGMHTIATRIPCRDIRLPLGCSRGPANRTKGHTLFVQKLRRMRPVLNSFPQNGQTQASAGVGIAKTTAHMAMAVFFHYERLARLLLGKLPAQPLQHFCLTRYETLANQQPNANHQGHFNHGVVLATCAGNTRNSWIFMIGWEQKGREPGLTCTSPVVCRCTFESILTSHGQRAAHGAWALQAQQEVSRRFS